MLHVKWVLNLDRRHFISCCWR